MVVRPVGRMTVDPQDRAGEASPRGVVDRPCKPEKRILDTLDIAEVGDIEIEFERPVSYPRPAALD